jgi:cell wall-associated NlpC family hydrolase
LAKVRTPALVIQGELDRVNAPARHAQFIAEHIPAAELWIPGGVGHNVHDERLFEWVNRVLDFFARRGDEANDALYRLKQESYPDERESVFELRAGDEGGAWRLSGRVLDASQRDAAIARLPEGSDASQVQVLLDESTPWALVNRTVHNMRREPRSLAERVNQVLLGEPLRILESRGDWCWVRLEADGYMGWTPSSALHRCEPEEARAYQSTSDVLVSAEVAPAYEQPGLIMGRLGAEAGKLVFGLRLPIMTEEGGWTGVRLPDGRLWWVESRYLLVLQNRPAPSADGIASVINLFRRFVGVPYLWGGRSPFGYDCSGLAQTFWSFLGVQIPRDADQQMRATQPVSGEARPGDLLFFGERDGSGHRPISHVAISLGGSEILHANGSAWGVSYNSLYPASPIYGAWLRDNLAGIGRVRL